MGNPFGSTKTAPTTLGGNNTRGFMNSLMGAVFSPSGQFQGVPAYQGQLTPDVNNTILPSVWNGWSSTNDAIKNFSNQFTPSGQGSTPSAFIGFPQSPWFSPPRPPQQPPPPAFNPTQMQPRMPVNPYQAMMTGGNI